MTSLSELRQRLLHPYYVIQFIYGSFFVFYRLLILIKSHSLEDIDSKALTVLAALSVWKCMMASTAEELTSVLILYTKVYTLWSLYWNAGVWRVLFYFAGWLLLSTVFPQPWYRGPTKLAELTETSFRAKVCPIKKKSSASSTPSTSTTTATMPASDIKGPRITEIKDDEDDSNHNAKYWVVMLYANWSVSCLNFEAVLAKLSLKYDASHLKFGKIDIDLYGEIAQEFGVSRDPASSFELPSLLLFRNGTEIRRLPELTLQEDKSNAELAKDTITRLGWSKRPATVIQAFQLDKLLAETS